MDGDGWMGMGMMKVIGVTMQRPVNKQWMELGTDEGTWCYHALPCMCNRQSPHAHHPPHPHDHPIAHLSLCWQSPHDHHHHHHHHSHYHHPHQPISHLSLRRWSMAWSQSSAVTSTTRSDTWSLKGTSEGARTLLGGLDGWVGAGSGTLASERGACCHGRAGGARRAAARKTERINRGEPARCGCLYPGPETAGRGHWRTIDRANGAHGAKCAPAVLALRASMLSFAPVGRGRPAQAPPATHASAAARPLASAGPQVPDRAPPAKPRTADDIRSLVAPIAAGTRAGRALRASKKSRSVNCPTAALCARWRGPRKRSAGVSVKEYVCAPRSANAVVSGAHGLAKAWRQVCSPAPRRRGWTRKVEARIRCRADDETARGPTLTQRVSQRTRGGLLRNRRQRSILPPATRAGATGPLGPARCQRERSSKIWGCGRGVARRLCAGAGKGDAALWRANAAQFYNKTKRRATHQHKQLAKYQGMSRGECRASPWRRDRQRNAR